MSYQINWYKQLKLSQQNKFNLINYISFKLNEKGITKENYEHLADAPAPLKIDPNHPTHEYLGQGSQNSVFKNKQTGRIEKYPARGYFSPSTSSIFENGKMKEITDTQFDALIRNINKAANLNVARKLLNTSQLNSTVDHKGIIHEDPINTKNSATWNKIKGVDKPIFYADKLRTNGQGNVFQTNSNEYAIVDGLAINPNNASSQEEKQMLINSLKQEVDRIVNNIKI